VLPLVGTAPTPGIVTVPFGGAGVPVPVVGVVGTVVVDVPVVGVPVVGVPVGVVVVGAVVVGAGLVGVLSGSITSEIGSACRGSPDVCGTLVRVP
jgi:hypothetical protein